MRARLHHASSSSLSLSSVADWWPHSEGHDRLASSSDELRGSPARSSLRHSTNELTKPVFIDAAAMKEKVRAQLLKPTHDVSDYYKDGGWAQSIARATWFENFTLSVIAFNALWISVDTDYNDKEILVQAHPVFQVVENFFCLFFSIEWTVRFIAFKRKRDCIRDKWFTFDTALVTLMVIETWVMSIVTLAAGGGTAGGLGNASILRVARLLRLSRMARMARLLRAMPELMILIKGMVAAMRSVFFTLFLLIIIMYVFAIAFTQLTQDTDVGKKHFEGVPQSMYTLLIYGTLLDDVGTLSRRLGDESIAYTVIFFAFVLLAALTVMNMLIGVLCEVVSAVAATEREEMLVGYVNRKVRKIVEELDKDGGGSISKDEFVQILGNVEAIRALQDVGVDVVGLVDFADVIFEDNDELSFSKFMEVVLQLRGSNTATVKDIVDLRKLVRTENQNMKKVLTQLQEDLSQTIGAETMSRKGSKRSLGPDDAIQRRFSGQRQSGHGGAVEDVVGTVLGSIEEAAGETKKAPQYVETSCKEWFAKEDYPLPAPESSLVHLLRQRTVDSLRSQDDSDGIPSEAEGAPPVQLDNNSNNAAALLTALHGNWSPCGPDPRSIVGPRAPALEPMAAVVPPSASVTQDNPEISKVKPLVGPGDACMQNSHALSGSRAVYGTGIVGPLPQDLLRPGYTNGVR